MAVLPDLPMSLRVPERKVGVEPDRDTALAAEAVKIGGGHPCEREVTLKRHPTGQQSFGKQQR